MARKTPKGELDPYSITRPLKTIRAEIEQGMIDPYKYMDRGLVQLRNPLELEEYECRCTHYEDVLEFIGDHLGIDTTGYSQEAGKMYKIIVGEKIHAKNHEEWVESKRQRLTIKLDSLVSMGQRAYSRARIEDGITLIDAGIIDIYTAIRREVREAKEVFHIDPGAKYLQPIEKLFGGRSNRRDRKIDISGMNCDLFIQSDRGESDGANLAVK